jgi:hypothetical protein
MHRAHEQTQSCILPEATIAKQQITHEGWEPCHHAHEGFDRGEAICRGYPVGMSDCDSKWDNYLLDNRGMSDHEYEGDEKRHGSSDASRSSDNGTPYCGKAACIPLRTLPLSREFM